MSKSKQTSSHHTFTNKAEIVRKWAEKIPEITKISAGFISNIGTAKFNCRIKIKHEQACLLLSVRGQTSIQDVRLYTNDKSKIENLLENFCKDNGFEIRKEK